MGDLNTVNRNITVKRYEHQKLVAQAQIQAREIRIMELEEEIERCNTDIELQNKVCRDMDEQIRVQLEEMAKKHQP